MGLWQAIFRIFGRRKATGWECSPCDENMDLLRKALASPSSKETEGLIPESLEVGAYITWTKRDMICMWWMLHGEKRDRVKELHDWVKGLVLRRLAREVKDGA